MNALSAEARIYHFSREHMPSTSLIWMMYSIRHMPYTKLCVTRKTLVSTSKKLALPPTTTPSRLRSLGIGGSSQKRSDSTLAQCPVMKSVAERGMSGRNKAGIPYRPRRSKKTNYMKLIKLIKKWNYVDTYIYVCYVGFQMWILLTLASCVRWWMVHALNM